MTHSFYGRGGGLPRGGMSGLVAGANADLDDEDLPDALAMQQIVQSRGDAVKTWAPGSTEQKDALKKLAAALSEAAEVLASPRGDDSGEEINWLRQTVAQQQRLLDGSKQTLLGGGSPPVPSLGDLPTLSMWQQWMPLAVVGGGVVALLWWMSRVERDPEEY